MKDEKQKKHEEEVAEKKRRMEERVAMLELDRLVEKRAKEQKLEEMKQKKQEEIKKKIERCQRLLSFSSVFIYAIHAFMQS